MERLNENISITHTININERKGIYVSGVQKIESFDKEEFLLDTNMGYLSIKGENLEIIKLDTKDGVISIKGIINSLCYIDTNKKRKDKTSMLDKLFKWHY